MADIQNEKIMLSVDEAIELIAHGEESQIILVKIEPIFSKLPIQTLKKLLTTDIVDFLFKKYFLDLPAEIQVKMSGYCGMQDIIRENLLRLPIETQLQLLQYSKMNKTFTKNLEQLSPEVQNAMVIREDLRKYILKNTHKLSSNARFKMIAHLFFNDNSVTMLYELQKIGGQLNKHNINDINAIISDYAE